MRFAMRAVGGLERLSSQPRFRDLTADVAHAVLDEAARFAETKLAPLYRVGDRRGVTLVDGHVRTAPGFREAYAEFARAGWVGLAAPPEVGGQGLPSVLGVPVAEIWRGANLAFALCPMLTQSAIEALLRHGTPDLRAIYLPKLVSGEWTATMNLTEPQAGSDLALIETVAVSRGDHYRLTGRKIFITWGDHDLADNIVHFVLARVRGAPPGVKGLSMFVVPKLLPGRAGAAGEPNDISVVSIEDKLGIHGSPTCVLSYGERAGAVGYLVGEEGQGLQCMFTLMNRARLAVGVEGLGVAERAYQQALGYARERVQGIAFGRSDRGPIVDHPDVRRMLLTMKAAIAGMRGVAYSAALAVDLADDDPPAAARAALLTPIVKGWCTELAQEVATLGLQVHGGAGYIEETGAAQPFRDVRITTIYEGTTGIQANDLVKRKILGDGGTAAVALLRELREWLRAAPTLPGDVAARLALAAGAVEGGVLFVVEHEPTDPALAGTAAVSLLLAFGTLLGGWHLAREAAATARGDEDLAWLAARRALATFYSEHLLPRVDAHIAVVRAGSASVMRFPEQLL
jgi:alkylation response protein AidB-like acyl-CoA dehydrogenase